MTWYGRTISLSARRVRKTERGTRKASRAWFNIHSWVGLKLSILMAFILITGTLAVFAHELDWLRTSKMRAAMSDTEPQSLGAMLDAASAAYPDWTVRALYAPVDPWFTAQAIAITPDRGLRRIYVDPYTGEVKGDGHWLNVQRILRQSHRHLMLPNRVGIPLVSSLSILLAFSMVTGVVVYKKWWRGFFRMPRTRDRRTLWGDIHRLCGLWSFWFILLIALTGFWYLVESLGGGAPALPHRGAGADSPAAFSAHALQMRAEAAFPELRIRAISSPTKPGAPMVFMGQAEAVLVRPRANFVSVDPATGNVLGIGDGRALGVHQRISEMADPLHFGTLGGLPTKIIWFLFGCALSALSLSGIYIYAKRCARSLESVRLRTVAWSGMGRWRYVGVVLIALCIILAPLGVSG